MEVVQPVHEVDRVLYYLRHHLELPIQVADLVQLDPFEVFVSTTACKLRYTLLIRDVV